MELDDRIELESRITTSHPFSTESGTRAPRLHLGHARRHITGSWVSVSDDNALTGKGWLR